jgi:serine/threonine protein kinase/Flp pilus assembly protein TadD
MTPPPVSNLARSSVSGGSTATTEAVTMPQPGDAFFGFRLVEEIGHGTFARVFLAKQESLANRKVALKVTLRPTREPERLASLQHTNVVPVYSVHTALPVQIICMPYLGRRTIADVLTGYRKSQVAPGHTTRKAVATRNGSSVAGSRPRSGYRFPPEVAALASDAPRPSDPLVGDVEAVLGIVRQLAEGLAHAHDRGVLHLDLKPANVLIADTGEPMLLDFNLSYAAFEGNREVVGGTIPYMAPEQLLDLQTRGKGEVDARTDLYSLGVMMFELLTGKHPFPVTSRTLTEFEGLIRSRRKGPPPLCELNSAVTPAVEAIVWKLLAPEPANRYQHAVDLREDIDRQLADRPLQFAADRSIPERLGKWRRRNPRVLVAMMLAAVLAAAGGTGAYAFHESEKRAGGQAEAKARDVKDNLDVIRLDLVLPNDPAARIRGMRQVVSLLGEFGLPGDPAWQSKPAFQRVPDKQREALAGNLGELLLLVAQARWEDGKTNDRKDAARDAWQLNQLAAGCFGNSPPPFLVRQKAELEDALAAKPVEALAVKDAATPREMFLDAVRLIAAGRYPSAIDLLTKTVLAEPGHGAAQFCLAFCRQQLGQYDRAVERYEIARPLMPQDPRPSYFCGVVNGLSGRSGGAAAAEECFSQSIEIDPRHGDSYKNRAFARMELGKWAEAEDDLTEALKNGASATQVYSLRSKVRHNRGDEEGAANDRQALTECRPEREADFIVFGISHLPGNPKAALAAFRTAEEKDPRSLAALRNQAHVLETVLHDDAGALKVMDRIAELYPEFGLNHARRAVVLARLGRRDMAHREAEFASKLSNDPLVTYLRACTYALTSKTDAGDQARAIELLKLAFRRGHVEIRDYEGDHSLDALRDMPEFAELLIAIKRLL